MKKVRKFFKKLDVFGVPFLFLYKNKNSYSTSLGGLTFILFCIVALFVAIYSFIPLFQRKIYSIVYYSMGMAETEKISLKESKAAFAFGFDCPVDEKMGFKVEDLLDIRYQYIVDIKDQEGNINKNIKILSTHPCNYSDFYNFYNFSLDLINIEKYQCLDETDNTIEGIWNNEHFSYYRFTVYSKGNSINHYKNIDDYLRINDCKLQLFYIDISIDLDDYNQPVKPYLNSIFLQLNPTLYIKRNVFFINQYFQNDNDLIYKFTDRDPIIQTLFSRYNDYSLYKGLDRGTTLPKDYQNYAEVFIRADTKKLIIKRRYQNLMECYADSSSLLFGVFKVLCFIFGFINTFYANISISKTLFYFKEIEGTNLDILKKYKQVRKLIRLTEPYIHKLSSNNFDFKELNRNNNKKNNNTYPLFKKETEEHKNPNSEEKQIYNKNKNIRIGVKENEDLINQKIKKINYMKKEDVKENQKNETDNIKQSFGINQCNSNIRLDLKLDFHSISRVRLEEVLDKKPIIEKIKYHFNIFELFIGEFFECCMTKKMKRKKYINSQASNLLYNKFDVVSYIKNMALLDIMKQTLLNKNTKGIVKFLTTPIITVNKKESIEKNELYKGYSEANFDRFYYEILDLVKNSKKLKYSKKLISLSYQQLKELQ